MKKLCIAAAVLSVLALACSGSNDDGPDGGPGNGGVDGGGTDGGTTGDGGTDGGLVITNPGGGTTVNLTFGNCPAFSACGGDEHGTWDYTAACDSKDYAAPIKQVCSSATVKSINGTLKGSILLAGAGIARDAVATVNLVITIPGSCATALGGCSGVQSVFQQAFSGATCASASAGACDCSATINRIIRDATTYTKAGNRITVANGDAYDFCVAGSKMTYVEAGSNASSGVFEMTKR